MTNILDRVLLYYYIVQCVDLAPPLNGGVSLTGTLVRDTASYSCDLGYVLESGDATRTCSEDGTWTGVMPTCASKQYMGNFFFFFGGGGQQ